VSLSVKAEVIPHEIDGKTRCVGGEVIIVENSGTGGCIYLRCGDKTYELYGEDLIKAITRCAL
jgi:hypothetical protein